MRVAGVRRRGEEGGGAEGEREKERERDGERERGEGKKNLGTRNKQTNKQKTHPKPPGKKNVPFPPLRYGLGCVHFRAEKWDMAEYHFRRASGIHPRSSVLRCYLGMAVARAAAAAPTADSASAPPDSRARDAVRELSRAVELDGRNPLARFELSAALSGLGEVEAALSALLPLLTAPGGGSGGGGKGWGSGGSVFASSSSSSSSPSAPSSSAAAREPAVWYQCARLLRRLGRLREARSHLERALDLGPAPADAARIRSVLDKCCVALVAQEQRNAKGEGGGEDEGGRRQLCDDFDESSGDEL